MLRQSVSGRSPSWSGTPFDEFKNQSLRLSQKNFPAEVTGKTCGYTAQNILLMRRFRKAVCRFSVEMNKQAACHLR